VTRTGDLPAIKTARLLLRQFGSSDFNDLIRIAGERAIADTMISVPHPFTATHAEQWIAQSQSETLGSGHIGFAVQEYDGAFIGYAGLHDIDHEHAQAELAFWIDPVQQGKGYAREAAQAVNEFAFETLNLNRICAFHMVRNAASERLLEKLGFVQEGYLRQRVRKWGKFEDVKLWALLR
jgi:[ribosomal protein S5]-alanine N-acetyltransferase